MSELKAWPLKTVKALKRYLSVLPDEQLIDVEIKLISPPDLSGCAQHQLASFMRDEYRPFALAEWRNRYGHDFPRYGSHDVEVFNE